MTKMHNIGGPKGPQGNLYKVMIWEKCFRWWRRSFSRITGKGKICNFKLKYLSLGSFIFFYVISVYA